MTWSQSVSFLKYDQLNHFATRLTYSYKIWLTAAPISSCVIGVSDVYYLMSCRYEVSEWGWSDKDKLDEMIDEKAWYLVARDVNNNNTPVACVHFRYDLDNDDEVLYWFVYIAYFAYLLL